MDKFIIRKCTLEDLDKVVSLQHKWVKEDITYGLTPIKKEHLESKIGDYFWISESNSEIIGFVYGTIRIADNMAVIDSEQSYIEIEDIYVSSDKRSTGLGSVLLDRILYTAKENGIERSLIYSSTKDIENIIKFYKKHDYKTWYIQMFK